MTAAILAGSAAACGTEDTIVLEVIASLAIPSQADELQVTTLDANDASRELAKLDLSLHAGQQFPLEVLFEPSDTTPATLRQQVTVLWQGALKAQGDGVHTWKHGYTTHAKMTLDLVP